tara:strand:+ start:101 stop:535 length:435 start_codon:yes stop_codon:yes gene_type:complete
MKVFFLIFFINLGFSQTSDYTNKDFITNFPFGKKSSDMTTLEISRAMQYYGYVAGFVAGNHETLKIIQTLNNPDDGIISIDADSWYTILEIAESRISNEVDNLQILLMAKKIIDDNPQNLHKAFSETLFSVCRQLTEMEMGGDY